MPLDRNVVDRLDLNPILRNQRDDDRRIDQSDIVSEDVPEHWAQRALSRAGQVPFEPPPPILSPKEQARIEAMTQEYYRILREQYIVGALPAFNQPTAWSLPVDLVETITVPGGVSAYQDVIRHKFPSGYWTRITHFGVSVSPGNYPFNGQLRWRIRVNGQNVPNLHDWTQQRGSLLTPRPTFILVPQDGEISFEVERPSGSTTYAVTCTFIGYRWRLSNDYEGSQAGIIGY